MEENESSPSTPEQLLQVLDRQLATQRVHREKSHRNRIVFLVVGVLLIVIVAGGALLFLEQILSERRSADRAATHAAGQ